MSKTKAIRLKCLDCSGDSPKEATLCPVVDCPLWPYRFGYSMKDKRYKRRMKAAERKYPAEYLELVREILKRGVNAPFLLEEEHIGDVLRAEVSN